MRPSALLDPLRGHQIRRRLLDLAAWVTPAGLLAELRHRRAQRTRREQRGEADGAFDPSWIDVDAHCGIAVFWSVVPGIGSGPSASVYVHDAEVMRLDCFGGDAGHMHLNPPQVRSRRSGGDDRIYFERADRHAHVARARFELTTNLGAGLAANDLARVRRHRPDPGAVGDAAAAMAERMTDLTARHAGT